VDTYDIPSYVNVECGFRIPGVCNENQVASRLCLTEGVCGHCRVSSRCDVWFESVVTALAEISLLSSQQTLHREESREALYTEAEPG
jgi:hypothetical protein